MRVEIISKQSTEAERRNKFRYINLRLFTMTGDSLQFRFYRTEKIVSVHFTRIATSLLCINSYCRKTLVENILIDCYRIFCLQLPVHSRIYFFSLRFYEFIGDRLFYVLIQQLFLFSFRNALNECILFPVFRVVVFDWSGGFIQLQLKSSFAEEWFFEAQVRSDGTVTVPYEGFY